MADVQSHIEIVALPVSAALLYVFYTHFYCSHQLLKTNVVFDCCQRIPSFGYVFVQYYVEAFRKKQGHLHACDTKEGATFTMLNCRLTTDVLRRFCSAAGYGWDYPDSEYRDIPLCYPEILCLRLMLIVLSAQSFRLSPVGLVRVHQSLKTFQPIDELKKGPFVLQAHVLEYRPVDAGVEVDISLSATSRTGQPVWESVLTLLSQSKEKKANKKPLSECQADNPEPGDVKKVDVNVPWTTGLKCVWSFSDYSPHRLLTIPARLLGYKSPTNPSLWMLSKCLAEIEKHKGVEAIRAPISVTAHFKEALVVPGKVIIKFQETAPEDRQSSSNGFSFQMEQSRTRVLSVTGQINRTQI